MSESVGSRGQIHIREDFVGSTGQLTTAGVGTEVVAYTVDEVGGILSLTTGSTAGNTAAVGTDGGVFSPAANGPLSLEVRIKDLDISCTAMWIGFSDLNADTDEVVEIDACNARTWDGSTCNSVGFLFDSAGDCTWKMVAYGSGAETAYEAASSSYNPTENQWQVFRVEVDPNGTARFYGADSAATGSLELLKTASGAVSACSLLFAYAYGAANACAADAVEIDYFDLTVNGRDWCEA